MAQQERKKRRGRWGLLTLGPWPDRWIGKAGRRICAAGPSAVQGSGWAEAEEAQARAVAGLARSTGRAGELLVLCSMQSCGRLLVQSSGERGERAARQTVTGAELHLAPARDKNGAGSRRGSGLGWRSATREGGRRIHRTGSRQGAPWMWSEATRWRPRRIFGLGARASGTRRRESAGWVNRAGEIPRGIRWSGGGVGMDGTLLLKFRVRGLFIGRVSLGAT